MKLPCYERIVETDTLYIVVTFFRDCTEEEALEEVENKRQMQSDKLLEVKVQKTNNQIFITETFRK
jgi:hypothetical protein